MSTRVIENRHSKIPRPIHEDPYEEVWDGVVVMSPLANNEHMRIVRALTRCLDDVIDTSAGDEVFPGCNVSDRNQGWQQANYRVPDIAVMLANGKAIDRGTHFEGGPDLIVEILSPGDRAMEKLPFYETIDTREVLIVHREPWKLELFQLNTQQKLELTGESDITSSQVITSSVLPLSFQLMQGAARPMIVMTHTQTHQRWEA